MKAYHIDRLKLLRPNQIIQIDKFYKAPLDELQTLISDYYPDGLSKHANQYYLHPTNEYNVGNSVYELLFEYERKLNFPELISRYQAFFALQTLDDVKDWLSFFDSKNQYKFPVWEIDTLDSKVQEYDSSLLGGGPLDGLKNFYPLTAIHHANEYWSGSTSETPRKELLIYPKVKVLKKIKPNDLI